MATGSPVPHAPRELPIVGGHLALDFANTVDDPLGPARHDHVGSYPDLLAWGVRVGAVSQAQAPALLRAAAGRAQAATAAVGRAHELRDVLNDIFGGIADGGRDTAGPWDRLRPFVVAAVEGAGLGIGRSGAGRWTWRQVDDLAVVLHPVAAAAADLLVSDDVLRVKRCARCPWLFLDRSKNRSRRWCDMNDCGRAEKIERYVTRRAARRRSPGELEDGPASTPNQPRR